MTRGLDLEDPARGLGGNTWAYQAFPSARALASGTWSILSFYALAWRKAMNFRHCPICGGGNLVHDGNKGRHACFQCSAVFLIHEPLLCYIAQPETPPPAHAGQVAGSRSAQIKIGPYEIEEERWTVTDPNVKKAGAP